MLKYMLLSYISMQILPDKIRNALEKIRQEYHGPYYIVIRRIKGRYYVYRDLRLWDKERKRRKTVSEYLGRIRDDGAFIRKEISERNEIENAMSIIEAHGGKVMLPENRGAREFRDILTRDEVDNKILTILSMNARATLPFIAKRVGLSVSAVDNRIKQLEKRYEIKYIAEINIEKLGYLKFVILIRFIDKIPASDTLQEVIKTEPRVQLALALSGGDFHVLMYVIAKTNEEVNFLARRLMQNAALSSYSIQMYITPFHESYCFVPLRNEFIDTLREKSNKQDLLFEDDLTSKERMLLEREFAVLKELNTNSAEDFTYIDRKYGFDDGRSQYSYHKLLKDQLLKRPTLTMQKLNTRYIAVIFIKDSNLGELYSTREPLLRNIIKDTETIINHYLLIGDIGAPYGILLFLPVFDNADVDITIRELLKTKGIVIQTEIVTNILIGDFCYRRFDNAYSLQAKILAEDYGMTSLIKTIYSGYKK